MGELASRTRRVGLSLAFFVVGFAPVSAFRDARAQDVVISEFLALNVRGLRDADGDASDWIEIHNRGDRPVNLRGWYLSDDSDRLTKWRFPDAEIGRDAFLIVFASGKAAVERRSELHASFRLSAEGEALHLVLPDGRTIVHEYAPRYPRQLGDVSYGITEAAVERYFSLPTPGSANDENSLAGFVADTRFSVDRGFYEEPFDVEISTDTENAVIRYTLDGTEPTVSRGELYRGPLRIDRTTTLRAAAFKDGLGPTNIDTQTYIFVRDVLDQRAMLKDVTGDGVYGPEVARALTLIPAVSIVVPRGAVPASPEVRASVEFLPVDGTEGFQIDAGIRRVGGHSLASYPKNNMRLYFRREYGQARLNYPLFESLRYGEGAADSFDQLTLRSGSHDSVFYLGDSQQPPADAQYLRNRWMSDMEFEMGRLSLHGRFVHVYINGEYWGHYQLMERPTRSFMASYFGGEKEDYEAVNSGRTIGPAARAWSRLRTARSDYDEARRWVDVTDLADYMLLNFYAGNAWDWRPNQNWMGAGPVAPDFGGYRFFSWDSDVVLRRTGDSNVAQGGPDNLFRDLLAHDEFRVLVADRIHRHFFNDGLLTPPKAVEIYRRRVEEISSTIIAETARWRWRGREWTRDRQWRGEWERLRDDFFPQRTAAVLEQLRRRGLYPDLEPPVFNQRGGPIAPGFSLVMVSPVGTVFYTVDGSDPRLPGGAVAPGAFEAGEGRRTTLERTTVVSARVFSAGRWSPLAPAVFVVDPGQEVFEPAAAGRQYVGDVNQDADVDLADAVVLLRLLFAGASVDLPCGGTLADAGNVALADVNGDGRVNLSDAVDLLERLFGGRPGPEADCVPIETCSDACRR